MMSIRDGDRLPHRRISTGSDLMKCGDRMIQKGYNGFIKIKLIVPYGLIINTKIKTQCTLKMY